MKSLSHTSRQRWWGGLVVALMLIPHLLNASVGRASALQQDRPDATTTPVATAAISTNPALAKGLQLVADGEWAAALAAFTQAQEAFNQAADVRGEAESWLQIAAVQLHEQEYSAAENAYRSALRLAKTLTEPTTTGMTWDGLGRSIQRARIYRKRKRPTNGRCVSGMTTVRWRRPSRPCAT